MAVLQFGNGDRMVLIYLEEGGKVQLEFVAANRFDVPNQVLVLTKLPVQLVDALNGAFNEKKDAPVEFAGENYKGRVCAFKNDNQTFSFTVVFEFFFVPVPIGYLLNMTREEMIVFIDAVRALPASPHPTD